MLWEVRADAPTPPAPAEEKPTFEEFYQANYRRVLGYLRKKVANQQDAEDLTSVVFTYCYQNWDRYDPEKASLSSWLFMIVNSRWKSYLRSHRTFADIDELSEVISDQSSPIEQAVELDAARQRIAEALKALPEKQRQVVVLRAFSGLDDFTIARKLDTTPGNVRVLYSRAVAKMRELMPDMDD